MKIGIVGRGVMEAVGVSVGTDVFVSVGSGDEVAVSTIEIDAVGVADGVCPQAVRNTIPLSSRVHAKVVREREPRV